MAKKKRMNAEERKQQILEHFYEVLIEEGIEGASIGKIAKHMGVHKSLLVHYFNKKEEMFVELIGRIIERYEQTFIRKFKEIDDPEKRLETVLDDFFGLPFKKLFGLPSTNPPDDEAFYACYYLTRRNEAVRKRFQEMYTLLRNELTDIIRLCMEEGTIPKGDPERIVDLLVVLEEGLNVCEIMRENDRESEDFRAYVKADVLDLLKNGRTSTQGG